MKRLGILGVCLLAMAAPAAVGAQPPEPSDAQDSNQAGQATGPSSEDATAEATSAAVHNEPDGQADLPAFDLGGNHEPGFNCRPKRMIARKGPPYMARVDGNAGPDAPLTGSFGDVLEPPTDLPPCDPD